MKKFEIMYSMDNRGEAGLTNTFSQARSAAFRKAKVARVTQT